MMFINESSVPSAVEGHYTMSYVYIIKNNTDKLYIGISSDPDKRLRDHNKKQGAEFTKSGNFKIVFKESYTTLAGARNREIKIKKWRRDKKELLIDRYRQGLLTKLN
jgi:putative endonuclease